MKNSEALRIACLALGLDPATLPDPSAPPPAPAPVDDDTDLSDDEWLALAPHLPPAGRNVRLPMRRFLDAALWLTRHQKGWTTLPRRYAPHDGVRVRFTRWSLNGYWRQICGAAEQSELSPARKADFARILERAERIRDSIEAHRVAH
jgi:transposase